MKNNIRRYGSRAHAFLPFYLFTFLLLLLLSSCGASEEDDLFPESAAQRLNHSVSYWKDILTGSPNGWALDYLYADGTYGGYVYTAKFTDEDVTMAPCDVTFTGSTGESWEPGSEITSKYSVKAEQGVILSIDTYNQLFHFFSEPKGSSAPDGYEGDYEFVLQKVSEDGDTVYMQGKKHGVDMIMYKLNNMDTKTFTENVVTMRDALLKLNLDSITVGDKTYPLYLSRLFTLIDNSEEDSVKQESLFFTSDGFLLRNPVEINGQKLQTFKVDNANFRFTADNGNAIVNIPSTYDQVVNTKNYYGWTFSSTEMDEESKEMYNTMDGNDTWMDFFYATGISFAIYITKPYIASDTESEYDHVMSVAWKGDFLGMFNAVNVFDFGIDLKFDENSSELDIKEIGKGYGWGDTYDEEYDTLGDKIIVPFMNRLADNSPYNVYLNDGAIKSQMRIVSKSNPDVWFVLNTERNLYTY